MATCCTMSWPDLCLSEQDINLWQITEVHAIPGFKKLEHNGCGAFQAIRGSVRIARRLPLGVRCSLGGAILESAGFHSGGLRKDCIGHNRGKMETFHPVLIYAGVMVGFVIANLIVIHIVGPSKKTAVKQMPYESGMDPIGDARQPFDVKFYLVAILFLVFDVELLFLYPWAVAAYMEDTTFDGVGVPVALRTTVFGVMLVFMGTLAIAYIYAWRKGVFKWR